MLKGQYIYIIKSSGMKAKMSLVSDSLCFISLMKTAWTMNLIHLFARGMKLLIELHKTFNAKADLISSSQMV